MEEPLACKKVYFSSKRLAKKFVKRFKAYGERAKRMRVYKCKKCTGYHYTSMDSHQIKRLKDERKI